MSATTMFRPSTVTAHKVRLQYSEATREKTQHPHTRNNHASFPSFHSTFEDTLTSTLLAGKTSNTGAAEKLQKAYDLPTVANPESLPGDCAVKEYVLENVTPYAGDSSFLAPATERTLKTWARCEVLMDLEHQRGILDVDTKTASTITSHGPGYVLSKEEDVIYGLQTDEPLKRACKPRGGFSVVKNALKSYGYEPDPEMAKTYTEVSFYFVLETSEKMNLFH
jgi:hypothetical protein